MSISNGDNDVTIGFIKQTPADVLSKRASENRTLAGEKTLEAQRYENLAADQWAYAAFLIEEAERFEAAVAVIGGASEMEKAA